MRGVEGEEVLERNEGPRTVLMEVHEKGGLNELYIETFLGQKYSLFAKFFNVIRHQKRKI